MYTVYIISLYYVSVYTWDEACLLQATVIKIGSEMKLEQMFIDFSMGHNCVFVEGFSKWSHLLVTIKSHSHQTVPAKTHRKPLRLPVLLPHFRRKATWTRSANFETRRLAGGTSSETSETKSARNKGKKDFGMKNEEVPMLFCMFFQNWVVPTWVFEDILVTPPSHYIYIYIFNARCAPNESIGYWSFNDPMSWLNMMEKKRQTRNSWGVTYI